MANVSLGASVDFTAYCTAEIAECNRMIDVYRGRASDSGVRAEHFIPTHLDKVLAEPLSVNLASIYFAEYSELMACVRAAAVINMPRKHFYEHAANCAKQELELHSSQMRDHNAQAGPLISRLAQATQDKLTSLAETSESAKATIVERIKANMGLASKVTLKEVVQMTMGTRDGVNPFGVSLDTAQKLEEFDKAKYSGVEARLACPCCKKLSSTAKFLDAFKALEKAWGKQLIITSGYRCPKHNRLVGGAERSQHLLGNAADIHVSSIEQRNELEAAASNAGFTGFGRANSFLHIDVGASRSWGYNSSGRAVGKTS